jgi:group I intron endonuclease
LLQKENINLQQENLTAFLGLIISLKWSIFSELNTFDYLLFLPTAYSTKLQNILNQHKLKPVGIWENLGAVGVKAQATGIVNQFSGVYAIINLVTGEIYVGSAILGRIGIRLHKHLFSGQGNKNVWAAESVYGLSNFAFVLLDTTSTVVTQEDNIQLLNMEDHYISLLLPTYNIAPQAGNTFGYKHTEETKALMKANYSSERREAIGSCGKTLSTTTIAKIRQAAWDAISEETRAKVSANSAKTQLYSVAKVSGEENISPDNSMVTSVTLRTLPVVPHFLKCDEKTVRRAIKTDGIVKKTWIVTSLGKANK